MKIDFKKDILPHLLIIVCFNVLVAVYFSAHTFQGKGLNPTDIMSSRSNDHEAALYKKDHPGEEVFWHSKAFGGQPTYLISIDYTKNVYTSYFNYVLNLFHIGWPIALVIIGLVSTYIFFIVLGVNKYVAAIGSIAYVFGSFFFLSLEAGHNTKVQACYYLPLVFAGMILLFDRQKLVWGGILVALGTSLEIFAAHYQITYYAFFALLFYGIVQFVVYLKNKELVKFAKFLVVLLIAGGLGVASNANKLLSVMEFSKESIRGKSELAQFKTDQVSESKKKGGLDKDYAFAWSQGIGETLTILVPGLYGNSSNEDLDRKSETAKLLRKYNSPMKSFPFYHGDQPFTGGAVYFGAAICLLFVFSLFVLEKKTVAWLLGGVLFSFFVSWGRNFEAFNYFIFDTVPGFNKFRTVSMALYLANFLFVTGAFLGLNKVISDPSKEKYMKAFKISGGILLGIILIVLFYSGSMDLEGVKDAQQGIKGELAEAVQADRLSIIRKDAFRSLIIIIISLGLLWAIIKDKLTTMVGMVLVGLVVTIDLWTFDKKYFNNDDFKKESARVQIESQLTDADNFILKDTSYYRVANFVRSTFNDAITSYSHNSIGGYNPVKMQRYQDLIEHHIGSYQKGLFSQLQKPQNQREAMIFAQSNGVMNMLNTKYIILGDGAGQVITNQNAYGNAWFVNNVSYVNNALEEINSLKNNNLKTTVYMDQSHFKVGNTTYVMDQSAKIDFVKNDINSISYTSQNSNDGFAVFSENYYPEWKAFVDGKETEVKRVNYVLRGIEIPKGNHSIEFKIVPVTYNNTKVISVVSSLTIVLLFLGAVVFSIKELSGKKDPSEAE